MLIISLAFLSGILVLIHFPYSLSLYWLLLTPIGIVGFFYKTPFIKFIAFFLLGFCWALWSVHNYHAKQPANNWLNQSYWIIGTVNSIPEKHYLAKRFQFNVQKIFIDGAEKNCNMNMRLDWYYSPSQLHVGDTWKIKVKIKSPNSSASNYQQWLLEENIHATGYVQNDAHNLLVKHSYFYRPIDQLRAYLTDEIKHQLNGELLLGLITALATGVRDEITPNQWTVMRGTGTNHLFAIAGLHIGFVAGFIYCLINFFWRRIGQLALRMPAQTVAAISSWVAALIYSCLAGFALPTQRAMVMLSVFIFFTVSKRHHQTWQAWSVALFIVLLLQPLSVLGVSFWLSFGAVAILIYGMSQRLRFKHGWRHWLQLQALISLGLLPLSLLFFQQAALAGVIANMIAIPWVGFLVLPLTLSGSLISLLFPSIGEYLLKAAESLLEILWPILSHIAAIQQWQWINYQTAIWIFLAANFGVILLLAPRGWPGRYLGGIGFLPLFIWQPAPPALGELYSNVLLDTGRSLVVLLQTHEHALLYEANLRGKKQININKNIVVLKLKNLAIKNVDEIILDHSASQVDMFDAKEIMTKCRQKYFWNWDNVKFSWQKIGTNCLLEINANQQNISLLNDRHKKRSGSS